MSPTQSGPSASEKPPLQSAEQRLEEVTRTLDEYALRIGLPTTLTEVVENEASRLLALEPGHLEKMSAQECGIAAFVLNRYAMHLQNAVNREQAKVRWAEASINKIVAPRVGQQKGYGFEERKLLAIRENDAAMKIDAQRVKAQLRLDRISFMSAKAENIVRTLMALQQTKRGQGHD